MRQKVFLACNIHCHTFVFNVEGNGTIIRESTFVMQKVIYPINQSSSNKSGGIQVYDYISFCHVKGRISVSRSHGFGCDGEQSQPLIMG